MGRLKGNRSSATRRAKGSALLLGFAIFALLWILHVPLRAIYVPNEDDISNLADSLLLAPGAHWYDWFTRGDSHWFDLYPDRPAHGTEYAWTGFSRPAFQFVIYLAHFVLGSDWASYQLINCFAVAGMGGVAFQIAQTALGLRTGPSLVAAMLVVLSPSVWVSWLGGVGYAIDPLSTVLVAGAFLAVLARRDLLCLALLFLALLTKENTLWAPLAAAITILSRPKLDESFRRRAFTAAAMLLPVAMWLGVRFAFFGGISGTYATAGYTPFPDFLKLIFSKLTHLHYLFISHKASVGELPNRGTAIQILDRGTALLIYALLFLWVLRILPKAFDYIRNATCMRWPIFDAVFLVALWGAIALAFHFVLPLDEDRYATSVVVFAWPALVAEVERRGKIAIWIGLMLLCTVSLTRTSYLVFQTISAPMRTDHYRWMSAYQSMNAVLVQVPKGIRQIYVLSAGSLQVANPKYVGPILGVSAEIVRMAEIVWNCPNPSDLVDFAHSMTDGVVSLTVTLPSCANFYFYTGRFNNDLANGRLYRNDTMSYDLPETSSGQPSLSLGRRMTVHVRPKGPARFIIDHGGPNGIAFFDTP